MIPGLRLRSSIANASGSMPPGNGDTGLNAFSYLEPGVALMMPSSMYWPPCV